MFSSLSFQVISLDAIYTHLFLGICNNSGICFVFSIPLDALCPHVSKVNGRVIASHAQYSCRSEASCTHPDRHTAISLQKPGNEMVWAHSWAPAARCSHRHKLPHCTHTKYFISCHKDRRLSNSGIVLLTLTLTWVLLCTGILGRALHPRSALVDLCAVMALCSHLWCGPFRWFYPLNLF